MVKTTMNYVFLLEQA